MAGKRGAAVLVDADDIPHDALRAIYSALSSGCDVRVFRVFGNLSLRGVSAGVHHDAGEHTRQVAGIPRARA